MHNTKNALLPRAIQCGRAMLEIKLGRNGKASVEKLHNDEPTCWDFDVVVDAVVDEFIVGCRGHGFLRPKLDQNCKPGPVAIPAI